MPNISFNEFHGDAIRKRLLKRAEARTTPQDMVSEIIKITTGSKITELTRVIRGDANEVYDIRTSDGQAIILRIGHKGKQTFQTEAIAIEQGRQLGVPVPTTVAIGEYPSATKSIYYCVQEKLAGTPLDTLLWFTKINKERARLIVENAGETLGRLHTRKTTGWGYIVAPRHTYFDGSNHHNRRNEALSETGQGEHQGINSKFDQAVAEKDRITEAVKLTNIRTPTIKAILKRLSVGMRTYEGNQRLLHGDFGPKHIFVDDKNNITGVIDWEEAESGDPVKEFARWNYWFEEIAPISWLRAGYERVNDLGENYDERFNAAKLENAIWTLLYYTYDSPVEDCAKKAVHVINKTMSIKG